MSATKVAVAINLAIPNLRSGSLRFWGDWFGRPYDNWHRMLMCEARSGAVIMTFNNEEILVVTEPVGLLIDANVFSIRSATKVRWEWFYYGLSQTAENRYFLEYVHDGKTVAATTNTDRHSPNLGLSALENAVEFL
jgi:hypothetical protein